MLAGVEEEMEWRFRTGRRILGLLVFRICF